MPLPLHIESLIKGNLIESNRLEFIKTWDPDLALQTICSFANDVDNCGGGYIILGVDANQGSTGEVSSGLSREDMDQLEEEINLLARKISPHYNVFIHRSAIQEENIIVVWCPGGDYRPYNLVNHNNEDPNKQTHYVRLGDKTVLAEGEVLSRLYQSAGKIPFDDRINREASLNDLNFGLIREYLQEVNSDLFKVSDKLSLLDLCKEMYIVKDIGMGFQPVNVGLLLFCKNPHRFIPRTQIELVWHNDYSGRSFKEYYFKGPIHNQLRDVLSFMRVNLIYEKVVKLPGRAEAERYFSYPIEALKEVLVNSIQHKGYNLGSPIEVQIFPDKIVVLSYPGALGSMALNPVQNEEQLDSKRHRNRRIGDFLKALHLSGGKESGLTRVLAELDKNGSPEPVFESDGKTYTLVTIWGRVE